MRSPEQAVYYVKADPLESDAKRRYARIADIAKRWQDTVTIN